MGQGTAGTFVNNEISSVPLVESWCWDGGDGRDIGWLLKREEVVSGGPRDDEVRFAVFSI